MMLWVAAVEMVCDRVPLRELAADALGQLPVGVAETGFQLSMDDTLGETDREAVRLLEPVLEAAVEPLAEMLPQALLVDERLGQLPVELREGERVTVCVTDTEGEAE